MSTVITPDRLASLLRPRSVALVGVSDKSAFSRTAYRNLVEFGMADRTHLVNRRGAQIHGRATVTSCAQIGEPVDVAFLMVPQAGTLDALTDAAAAGIRNAVILSSGYGETGADGRKAQAELVAHAESLDMLLLGPNQLGFANFVERLPVTAVPDLPHRSGPVALLSQSGASSMAMLEFARMSGADLSHLVTLGNEAMITAGHVLDFLVDDEHTRAVAIFMETIREPGVFRSAARRAAAAGKPVVVLKAGSSELAARTAAAHTGALVGDDRTVDAIFRDLGVIRVGSIEDLLITAGTAAHLGRLARPGDLGGPARQGDPGGLARPDDPGELVPPGHSGRPARPANPDRPTRPGIGVVSISGGACDIFADRAADLGAALPSFGDATREALAAIMPEFGAVQNPLDVTGAAVIDPTLFTRSIEAVSVDPGVGVVAVVNSLPWEPAAGAYGGQPFVDAIGEGIRRSQCPVVYVNQVLEPITERTREVMAAGGVPHAIPGLLQAVVALRNVAWWSEVTRELPVHEPAPVAVPDPQRRRGTWSEAAARTLLTDAGIPVVPAEPVTSAEQAVRAAGAFDGPVALKISAPEILHKSDIGGVRLDVRAADAAGAYEEVVAAAGAVPADGVLVSPMRSGGVELLVGVVRDPDWGPLLAVALGGVFVEVLGDSTLAPLPVSPARARGMLDGLRGAALLHGVRGGAAADLDRVAEVVSRVGDLALAMGEDLDSLEINPLWVAGETVEALDAVVTWTGAGAERSGH